MRLIEKITGGSRRGLIATAVAAVLVVGGGTAIGVAVSAQESAPSPPPSAAGTASASAAGTTSPSPSASPNVPGPSPSSGDAKEAPATHGPTMDASRPVSISIPAIDVHSSMIDLGLTKKGTVKAPQPGPDYGKAAWYTGSPTPGELGPSIIEGHVDSAKNGPSVFFKLGNLRPGNHVRVKRRDGKTAEFAVTSVIEAPKDHFPTVRVYNDTDHAALRLITCGGSFNHETGHYRSNIIAFAKLVGSARAS
jgi:sortase (surface protein transpeptidase)